MFSQVDVLLGNKIVSSSTNTYSYTAYLEALLNYGSDYENNQLQMGLFFKDKASKMNDFDPEGGNDGLTKRNAFGKLSKIVHLQGRIHNNIFNQGRLLLNGLPLRITLQRQKNDFILLTSAENPSYKLSFNEVIFCVRKVLLTPHKFQSIQQKLERSPALYPIHRTEFKTHSVAQGLSSVNWENAILGQLPKRIFLGMLDNTSFSGAYGENPYLFKHNNITSVGAFVNGKSLPANPIRMNIENGDYLDGYRSLFTATGKINRDEEMGISRKDYIDGYTLVGFDLSPALCAGEHQEFKRNGNLRLSLEFGQPLSKSTTIILYCEYDNLISVYKSREIVKDW